MQAIDIVTTNWRLIWALTKRQWTSRGKGGVFSFLWPILTPVFLLGVYYFAFGVILNLRHMSGECNYALSMFCGMAVFNVFAESMNAGATSIIQQPSYVKNATFDLEVLPLSAVGCAVISGAVYLAVVLLAAVLSGIASWQLVLLFEMVPPYLLFCAGIAMFCGAISVFLRDFPMFLILVQQALFFGTPIIFTSDLVPGSYRWLIYLNPLAQYVEAIRYVILGTAWTGHSWMLWLWGIVVYLLGWAFFHKTKRGFADVI